MAKVTFELDSDEGDPLDKTVTATMTLWEVKLIAAILGPLNAGALIEAVTDAHGEEEAEFISLDGQGVRITGLWLAVNRLLERVGHEF